MREITLLSIYKNYNSGIQCYSSINSLYSKGLISLKPHSNSNSFRIRSILEVLFNSLESAHSISLSHHLTPIYYLSCL